MKALQGGPIDSQDCSPTNKDKWGWGEGVGGQCHSPGLLQAVQAEGDSTCRLSAESKAAQPLSLGRQRRCHQFVQTLDQRLCCHSYS